MPSTNIDDYTLDILKEEYSALRTEIVQSISKQHQITLSGYGLTAVFSGYILQKDSPSWELLAIIPFILLAMTSLWTVECNRMVRASYYIGYILWPALKSLTNIPESVGWETWIRVEDDNSNGFRKRQNYLQLFVEVITPSVISFASLFLSTQVLLLKYGSWIVLLWLVVAILWGFLLWQVKKVSNLSAIIPKLNSRDRSSAPYTSAYTRNPPPVP